MADVEILLRDLGREPAPLDVAAVRGRAMQRRRRRQSIVGAVAIVVAAVGAFAVLRDDGTQRVRTISPPPTSVTPEGARRIALPGRVYDVTSDGTNVYALGDARSGRTHGYVAKLDPSSGRTIWRTDVAGGGGLGVGLGRIWAFGGESTSHPNAKLAVLDPANGRVTREIDLPLPARDIAFGGGLAWVATGRDFVTRIDVDSVDSIPVPGPAVAIVATDDHTLWVDGNDTIAKIDVAVGHKVSTQLWSGDVLAGASDGRLWSRQGERLVELSPDLLATGQSVAIGTRIDVQGSAVAVDRDGLWVAAGDRVLRFPTSAIQPSVIVPLGGAPSVFRIASTPGAVWFTRATGELYRYGCC